ANIGIIAGSGANDTVYFGAGGTVTNNGVISGANDIVKIRIDGLVSNYSTIAAGAGTAVWLPDGGTIVNYGLITGTDGAVYRGFGAGGCSQSEHRIGGQWWHDNWDGRSRRRHLLDRRRQRHKHQHRHHLRNVRRDRDRQGRGNRAESRHDRGYQGQWRQ